jgi:ABC-type nickel/cobalt efflux system permease component RcnA
LPGAPVLDPAAVGQGEPPDGRSVDEPGTRPGQGPPATGTRDAVAAGAVPGGVGADIAGLLQTGDLTPLVLLGSLVAATALGAGHALTPGHGKTLMGAYLVGTRGTALHAVALGLSVTVSHTLGIVVLAAIVILFRGVLPAETFDRVAPVVSGILVLGIGTWLVADQLGQRRAMPGASIRERPHGHDHPHHDGHPGRRDRDHDPGPGRTHGHDVHRDLRDRSPRPSLTWRSLFVLGLAGGVIPSTNALIILLATIATGRAVYGLVLVVAFGLGMALVLGGVGLGLVLARDRLDGLPSSTHLGRVAAYAPLMAGIAVFTLGLYLTTQAVGVTPTL